MNNNHIQNSTEQAVHDTTQNSLHTEPTIVPDTNQENAENMEEIIKNANETVENEVSKYIEPLASNLGNIVESAKESAEKLSHTGSQVIYQFINGLFGDIL